MKYDNDGVEPSAMEKTMNLIVMTRSEADDKVHTIIDLEGEHAVCVHVFRAYIGGPKVQDVQEVELRIEGQQPLPFVACDKCTAVYDWINDRIIG